MPDRLRSTGKRNPLPYDRSHYGPGEEFTASSVDARILVMAGLATRVEDEEVPALLQRAPAAVREVAEAPATKVVVAETPKRKRGRPRKGEYLRRDLGAEE